MHARVGFDTPKGAWFEDLEDLKKFIDRTFRDPIAGVLLKYSNLTVKQYESLIIDLITDKVSDISLTYSDKALLRSKNVSRGSFSRTLSQARRNIISAIYTILLLSYIGVFDEAPFDEFHILSEKLREYVKLIQEADSIKAYNVLKMIEKELMEGIKKLSEPGGLKIM
ncbi:hypothetical protein AC482_00140 [miscellaneous Crenarchaeota group-15 archaeon DG-45]|uniref:Uncharacterized protein n=1 Tax=miscellaneous Crenarchaeota group-15 archaeon DG-45 TaxID=1685127 RepID=A0A0M0BSM6_9ARCH|nr:MAG: hypothetical protein AC482_00140 [miscellaneous Crenarchaeota group-15 archaeon DG-45]